MNDPILGKLEQRGKGWFGLLWLEQIQQNIDIEIEYRSQNSPSPEEQTVFAVVLENFKQPNSGLEKALLHHLLEVAPLYRDSVDDITVPQHASEVWSIVQPKRMWIDSHAYDKVCATVMCEFIWDIEHGIDIDFMGDEIGIAEGGCHWSDKSHYTLSGEPI